MQELNLITAHREAEKAVDEAKKKERKAARMAEMMKQSQKESAKEARLLRKRAAQLLTGASLATGAAFYEAMKKRKQLEEETGIIKEEDDLDDIVEALRIDDIESGVSRPTTARDAEDEYDSADDDQVETSKDNNNNQEVDTDVESSEEGSSSDDNGDSHDDTTTTTNINSDAKSNDGLIKSVKRKKKIRKKMYTQG